MNEDVMDRLDFPYILKVLLIHPGYGVRLKQHDINYCFDGVEITQQNYYHGITRMPEFGAGSLISITRSSSMMKGVLLSRRQPYSASIPCFDLRDGYADFANTDKSWLNSTMRREQSGMGHHTIMVLEDTFPNFPVRKVCTIAHCLEQMLPFGEEAARRHRMEVYEMTPEALGKAEEAKRKRALYLQRKQEKAAAKLADKLALEEKQKKEYAEKRKLQKMFDDSDISLHSQVQELFHEAAGMIGTDQPFLRLQIQEHGRAS